MRLDLPLLAVAALLSSCLTDRAWHTRDVGLERQLAALVAEHAPNEIAVAYLDLESRTGALLNADTVMHAASTMKVPVMIELFRQAAEGQFALDDEVSVRNRFRSIMDGSPYALTPADDSDRELYGAIGTRMSIRQLMHRMIAKSSNLATNILIERCDPKRVQSRMETLGTRRMEVLRGVEDIRAYRAGRSNTATAADLMCLMASIADGRAAPFADCQAMLSILTAQEFNESIPRGLPRGTTIAHKTGWITAIRHDAAIVYEDGHPAYVLVVLTRGFRDPNAASAAMADVARCIHRSRL